MYSMTGIPTVYEMELRRQEEQLEKMKGQLETIKQLTNELKNKDDALYDAAKKKIGKYIVQSIVDDRQSISDSVKANDELIDYLKSLLAKEK